MGALCFVLLSWVCMMCYVLLCHVMSCCSVVVSSLCCTVVVVFYVRALCCVGLCGFGWCVVLV